MLRRIGLFLARNRVTISGCTVALYVFALIPATIILFPDSNLWLGLLVVTVGLMDELKDFAEDIREEETA